MTEFNIAISRIAAFAQPRLCNSKSIDFPEPSDLRARFERQANRIAEHPDFMSAQSAIAKRAMDADPNFEKIACTKLNAAGRINDIVIESISDEFLGAGAELFSTNAFVARLRSDRYRLCVGDVRWILRTRASVTSCALEHNTRPTKLWWSFEGIPENPSGTRPSEEHVNALLQVANKMEADGREGFQKAFFGTLTEALGAKGDLETENEKLRIAVTESAAEEVDALLDAMYVDAKNVSDIRNVPADRNGANDELIAAHAGLRTFEDFARHVLGDNAQIDDGTVFLHRDTPQLKGVFCRRDLGTSKAVAGFTRRVGAMLGYGLMSKSEQVASLAEEQIRLRSAARPLSALLANAEAKSLDPQTSN